MAENKAEHVPVVHVTLQIKACEGDVDLVKQVLQNSPALTKREMENVIYEAAKDNYDKLVGYLLDQGAQLRGALMEGSTLSDDTSVFQVMYDHGWQRAAINEDMAIYGAFEQVAAFPNQIKWLVEHGMDPNLHAQRGMTQILGNVTLFNMAARYASVESLELLSSYGVETDSNALFNSVWWRDSASFKPAVLQWLLDHGANINHQYINGATVIHMATKKRHAALVEFLLQHGADPSIPVRGQTTVELAHELELEEILNLFDTYKNQATDSK